MKVGIIGNGWVGKAMKQLFPDAYVYVRDLTGYDPMEGYTNNKANICACDVVFIAVPTPNLTEGTREVNGQMFIYNGEGILDTSAVEECIAWCSAPLLVVRSTVNPGDCNAWRVKYGKRIVMQPEYLGETPQHPLLDVTQTNFLVIGGEPEDRRTLIELYTTVYNANVKIRQVSAKEAEIIKLSENRAIAYKVAQCQELYDVCEKAGVDYYEVRDAVYGDDPRFNLWWTFVYSDKRGFRSKCIPKDVYAWCAFAESLGYDPQITRALLEKNKEWIGEKVL